MAINERLVHTASAAAAGGGTGNQEEGLILHLDANDVDSYDGDGDVWYDIHDHEYTPATNVSEHFNTVLFQSNNQVAQSITGVGFQPDLILGKTRQDAASWDVYDSLRGISSYLGTNLTNAEGTSNCLDSFDVDGFSLGTASNFNYYNNRESVAWCFKAGGLLNKSAEFNGSSSKITLPSSLTSALDVSTKTISMWVKADPQSSGYGMPFSMNSTSLSYGRIIFQLTNSSNLFEFLIGSGGSYPSATIVPGTWYHMAVSINGSSYECFVNGTSVGTGTNNNHADSSGDTTIGVYNVSNNYYWDGKISQVRLFNSALTSSQITQLYNETPLQNDGHLLGCIAAFPLNDNVNEIDNNYTATASNVTFGLPGYANRNNEGTIESTVTANNDLGFSIVKWTGNDTTGGTIGHGLSSTPELTIIKKTSGANADWQVSLNGSVTGVEGYMNLNQTAGLYTTYPLYYTSSNSTVLSSNGTSGATRLYNNQSAGYIAYCFASKRGVSKVGSYTGTGAADNKVYTGFEPAFVMVKRTDGTGNWMIHDNKRSANNGDGQDLVLYPDLTNSEDQYSSGGVVFNSNGFTLNVTASSANLNNGNYIYYAVAKDTNETELTDTVGFKPSIDPDDHFNTVIWNGDGYSSVSITGVGFQPDLVWVKQRNLAQYHSLSNSISGVGKMLWPNATDAEYSTTTYGQIASFDSDGFTANKGSDPTYSYFNASGGTYVAWCFKAGGAAVTNTDGTTTSQVSANNDLGFSIVKTTGTSGSINFGHGLDTAPEMIINKGYNASGWNWLVYHKDIGTGKYLILNSNTATTTSSGSFSSVTATTITNSSSNSTQDYINYCFTSKRGVSKVGSYVGTGAGTSVTTEFEPAFVMIKKTSGSADWIIFNNKTGSNILKPNVNAAEVTLTNYITYDSTGFTFPTSDSNLNIGNFIYYAVAKNTNDEASKLELNLEADSYSGSGNWLDSSGNGNNGTITGATHNDELGDFFEFDGSDYIETSYTQGANTSATFESWININSTTGRKAILGDTNSNGSDASARMASEINGNVLKIFYGNGSSSNNFTSSTSLDASTWYHVCISISGTSVKFYINGDETDSFTSSFSYGVAGAQSFTIGAFGEFRGNYLFNGKIGQVRAYSTALSQAQIRQNFNFTKPKYPNEFHGDISGATWNPGGYFDFDGSNDKVTITSTSTSPIDFVSKNYTIAAWINPDTSGVNQIFTKYGISDSLRSVSVIINTDNTIRLIQRTSSSNNSYSTSTIPQNTWTHIVVTRSSSEVKFYINGQLDNTVANTFTPNSGGNQPILIGSNASSTPTYFNGQMSKVKAYNTVLAQAEITALYNEGE